MFSWFLNHPVRVFSTVIHNEFLNIKIEMGNSTYPFKTLVRKFKLRLAFREEAAHNRIVLYKHI